MTALYENRILQSEAMATSPWSAGPGVTRTNNTSDVTDPQGGNTATKLVYDASSTAGNQLLIQQLSAVTTGTQVAQGIWIRLASGSSTAQMTTNVSGVFAQLATLDTTWRFFEADQSAILNGTWFFLLYRGAGDNIARTYYVAFAQAREWLSVGVYKKTMTQIVTGPSYRWKKPRLCI
jgi:hypothetical protein